MTVKRQGNDIKALQFLFKKFWVCWLKFYPTFDEFENINYSLLKGKAFYFGTASSY